MTAKITTPWVSGSSTISNFQNNIKFSMCWHWHYHKCFVSCKSSWTFVLRALQELHYGLSNKSPNRYGSLGVSCRKSSDFVVWMPQNNCFRCLYAHGDFFSPLSVCRLDPLCEHSYNRALTHTGFFECWNARTHAHTYARDHSAWLRALSIAFIQSLSNCDYITRLNESRAGTYNISNSYRTHN